MGNPAGRTFCRRCGAKLGGPVAATAQIPVARGPGLLASPGVRQLLGALVLAAVAFAIIFPLRNAEHSAYNAILDIFR
jgi:hypothetical protein